MAKNTYTAAEAWAVFFGGLLIGIVVTSFFWAYITVPKEVFNLDDGEIEKLESVEIIKPVEFINFCEGVKGKAEWDDTGYRSCSLSSTDQKDVVVMSVFCKKFNLTMSYGSFGVECQNGPKI